MSNSPKLETYKLFYEHIPIPKPAVKKPARKRKSVAPGRSLLETHAQ